MSDKLESVEQIVCGRNGVVDRRTFLKTCGLGAAGATFGFADLLADQSKQLKSQGKSVIVLWMQGGPTQFETFDPKSGEAGCQTKTIATAVPGVQIADYWPEFAKRMNDIAVIRSMTSKEGNHQRATYQLHTGYAPSGTLKHPSLGALVASEIGSKEFDLPNFVSILGPSQNAGFLPNAYAPFRVGDPTKMPANVSSFVGEKRLQRRLNLLKKVEAPYAAAGAKQLVTDHQNLYDQAAKMVLSPKLKAFDVAEEKTETRERYGKSPFSQGCLLARRLVEAGASFVEVQLGNWDTHDDNANRVKNLAGQCDRAMGALLDDLKTSGRLANTLIVWMGEFGRTPRVNPRGGRDHYPRSFNVAVAGCGIKGGRVIGKTNGTGSEVTDNPVTVNDLFHTFAKQLGIDPAKENQTPVGRPIKIVDGGKLVKELVS